MKAILLVAGYATRLYPLTLDTPKALLPINGRPMLDYIVDEINKIDEIDCIYVVSNHKFINNFEDWSKTVDTKKTVKVIDDGTETEVTRRGAIGDIYYVVEQEKVDDEIVVIAGDNYFTFDLKDYFNYFKRIGKDCVCTKRHGDIEQLKQFAVAQTDTNGRIIDLVEKPSEPKSDLAVYATYFYKRDTVPLFHEYLRQGNKPDAPGYFVQWLYKVKDVYSYEMQGECYDVGTLKNYEEVQKLFI